MAEGVHVPTEDQIARAAAILNEGLKIAILAGEVRSGRRPGSRRLPNVSMSL